MGDILHKKSLQELDCETDQIISAEDAKEYKLEGGVKSITKNRWFKATKGHVFKEGELFVLKKITNDKKKDISNKNHFRAYINTQFNLGVSFYDKGDKWIASIREKKTRPTTRRKPGTLHKEFE